jgi:hypothetical protein
MINKELFYNYKTELQPDGSYINHDLTTRWYNAEGLLHKEDGPAVIFPNGGHAWCLHGYKYSFKDWIKLAPISDEQKLLLKLQYA